MTSEVKDISIVIPVFNGELSLKELNDRLTKTLTQMKVTFELIYVDDNSSDESWNELLKLQIGFNHVSIIRLAKNFGQHNATICGMSHARGKTIITMDDDLEHPPEKIPELYHGFLNGNYDVYYAYPIHRRKSFIRNSFSQLWAKLTRYSKKGIGKASSFRIMKKNISDSLSNHKEPFVYIEAMLFWYTKNIHYKEINFDKRKYGNSNYSIFKLFELNHDLGMHYDTHILKFMKNFGVTVFAGSMLLIAYYLHKKLHGNVVPGYTSLIIVLLFSTGILFWGMGYLGIYIGKMFRILNKEPQYQISEKKMKAD